jgi:hypothetical protein
MTARRTAIPAPMYVLIADFSSLVIRPPRIGFAMNLIESAISSIRQGGIPLRLIFCIAGGDLGLHCGMMTTRRRSCPQESCVIGYLNLMAREFKPVRFFVMPYTGGTAGVLGRRESRRASAARRKIAHARGIKHDGAEVFRAARIG